MTYSINQPWAISEKYANRYGATWTNLDFIFEDKISAENFKTDPMNCAIGQLRVAGLHINMRYKDLISYSKSFETLISNIYGNRVSKTESFPVEIKGRTVMLVKHEIAKLNETINDELTVSLRSYELGLYL